MTEFNPNVHPIREGVHGGGGGGGMESRIARLEATSEHMDREISDIKQDLRGMRQDFREDMRSMRTDTKIVWAFIFTTTAGLAGLMAKGFGWL